MEIKPLVGSIEEFSIPHLLSSAALHSCNSTAYSCNTQLHFLQTSVGQWSDMEMSSIAAALAVNFFTGWIIFPVLKLS